MHIYTWRDGNLLTGPQMKLCFIVGWYHPQKCNFIWSKWVHWTWTFYHDFLSDKPNPVSDIHVQEVENGVYSLRWSAPSVQKTWFDEPLLYRINITSDNGTQVFDMIALTTLMWCHAVFTLALASSSNFWPSTFQWWMNILCTSWKFWKYENYSWLV